MSSSLQPPTGEQLKEIIQGPSDVEWRSVSVANLPNDPDVSLIIRTRLADGMIDMK